MVPFSSNYFFTQKRGIPKRALTVLFILWAFINLAQNPLKEILISNAIADSLLNSAPTEAAKAAKKALDLSIQNNNDTLIYQSRFLFGIASFNQADYNNGLSAFIDNAELAKKLNDKSKIVQSLNAVGNAYKNIEKFDLAIQTFEEALSYCTPNKPSSSSLLIKSNLIGVYRVLNKNKESLKYCYEVAALLKKYKGNDTLFMSNIYGELLFNYMALNETDSVNKYLPIAIDLKQKSGDEIGLASFYHNIGDFYQKLANYKVAEDYYRKAIATNHENLEITLYANSQLAVALYKQKKYQEAAEKLSDCLKLKDSIAKIQTIEKLSEMEVKYETGKKEEEVKRLSAEKEIDKLKVNQSKIYTAIAVTAVLIFVVIAFLLFRQNKNKQAANKLLQQQNDEISHQKKEITDSINYAKRIQLAILPPDKMVSQLLPTAFIFYKPKDVVSGDFYWVEEKNGQVMFAAVDCTGHGVPGAMMSVVGLNLLNRAVNEKELTKPSDILQYLDMGVTDTLRQNKEKDAIKDGMDLSLCSYNPKTLELQYAGAFNNLWIVRKNIAASHLINTATQTFFENDLLEIKADKFPIGSNTDGIADTYTNHTFQLQKGDCVYLYSDGFADQFGGPKGKKFKYNALKKLLVSIHELSPSQQRERIQTAYNSWKGDLEQIDDILIIGVCI